VKRSTVALVVIVLLVLGAVSVYEYAQSSGSGTLSIGFADAPSQGVSHVYVTLSGIFLQVEGNSSVSYKGEAVQFDLLSLVNVTKFLGNVTVPAGNYTMIRFTVAAATATVNGANASLIVPSGEVKVPLSFQVVSGKRTAIVLDITVDMTSISASGNLRPVVTVRSVKGPG